MKERPILFKGDMVCAILENRKTQTRRVVKGKHHELSGYIRTLDLVSCANGVAVFQNCMKESLAISCPYGKPGDLLWVRETWRLGASGTTIFYRADNSTAYCPVRWELQDMKFSNGKWHPSIFMKRWASRISLEVVSVRVERLQAIAADDCNAEGCPRQPWFQVEGGPEKWYRTLWNKINMDRGYGWDNNPWVWVVEFKVISDSRKAVQVAP